MVGWSEILRGKRGRGPLAVPAASRTGTINDIEHIVVFMQENRSFDHYFGHMRGVRGYNDRFPIPLPGGNPVWFQPSKEDATKPVLPFHLDTLTTSAQCPQSLLGRRGRLIRLGIERRGEARDHARINRIRFSQLTCGPGEVANLSRVHHAHPKVLLLQRRTQ